MLVTCLARLLACAPAVVAALAVAAPAAPAADVPTKQTLYRDGPDGRFLLGGGWLFRADPDDRGIARGWQRPSTTAGWTRTEVPGAWNVGDHSVESMVGGVGWYRKDFELPDARAALDWIVRFESVNYRARAWLNGRPIGVNEGAYLPFELRLRGVKRRGVNRLVVRVDSRRLPTDFPPSGLTSAGTPSGGWWNYGGILREVYLRRVDAVDIRTVDVRPVLPCAACDAAIRMRVGLRNLAPGPRTVRVSARFGGRAVSLGTVAMPRGADREAGASFTLRDPKLWSPERPHLYRVRLDVSSGGRRVAGYDLRTGVRSIKVTDDGRMYLNGEPLSFRGVGYHEDTRERGFAITNADREWLVREAKAVGATLMRTHYPPHPYLHELADREGMLLWSEIPVYSVRTSYLTRRSVRKLAARELRRNIEANRNHPSVIVWSIANELSAKPGPSQGHYIRRAVAQARRLDPTRPVGIAIFGYPSSGCHDEYGPLDVIGVNEYFGWYPGPNGQTFDRTRLSAYLDQVRACYPDKAIVVSEFGAEANRDGPVEEKGTWGFQQEFVNYHMSVFATKPWLAGVSYWALNEFRVRPNWDGGNPRPQPPVHQKGVITYDRSRKPSFYDLQRWFTGNDPVVLPLDG